MKKENCQNIRDRLGAYYDGQLSPQSARELEAHLRHCESCARRLAENRLLSGVFSELAREEAARGGSVSLWPAIRLSLAKETAVSKRHSGGKLLSLLLRPAWIGLGLSTAAAVLTLVFSGVLSKSRLPENYCRIESISAPENNLMIYRGESDGLTIIWLME